MNVSIFIYPKSNCMNKVPNNALEKILSGPPYPETLSSIIAEPPTPTSVSANSAVIVGGHGSLSN